MWLIAVVGSALALAGGQWLVRTTGTRDVLARLESLGVDVSAWQEAHRTRMRALERRMTDIEMSVANAEEEARAAEIQMVEIRTNLVRRLEQIEQRMEIQLLVRQGRIPPEHLPEAGVDW